MPGRTREGARVSRLYKLKMQGRLESPQEEKKEEEKKVEPKKEEDNSE